VGLKGRSRPRMLGATAGAVLAAALMLFVVPAGLASAAPIQAAGSASSETWAYGAVRTVTFSGFSASGGVPYTGNATFGYTVLITQYNSTTDPHQFHLVAQRTMGASFNVEYCLPTCRLPTYFAKVSARAWESVNSSSFLVNNGTVYESGTPVPAVALENASTQQVANYTESTSTVLPAAAGGGSDDRTSYLGVGITASAAVEFSSPLGLFPTDLSTSQSWNSSAEFQAEVDATYQFLYAHLGPGGAVALQRNGSFPVQTDGTVALTGTTASANTIPLGGSTYSEVGISLVGPFSLWEGFILVPAASDLFQTSSGQPWASNESGAATASMSYVDLRGGAPAHLGVGASRWLYDSASLEPTDLAPASNGLTEFSGTGSPDSAPQTVVQGEPETAAESQATEACLMSGSGCNSASSGPSWFHGAVALLIVGLAAVGVLVVAVGVVERRRMPPPAYPNAALYPPGASGAPARAAGPASPPPPPPEEDPLGNLW
jgi:hypothetical protein